MDECVFSKVNACGKLGKPLSDSRPRELLLSAMLVKSGMMASICTWWKNWLQIQTFASNITETVYLERLPKRASSAGSPNCEAKRHRRSEIPPFDFLCHCIFCGEICELERDNKNPSRWRRAVLCRTAERGSQKILQIHYLGDL